MTNKELLIQEIENLPPKLLTEALDLICSIKVNYTKNELEPGKLEPISLSDSRETFSEKDKEQLTYRPASKRSILRHLALGKMTTLKNAFKQYMVLVVKLNLMTKTYLNNVFT
ncbi:hypothetical protein LC608_09915 [Nostoc sp. XA010]|uniref:hypothetical protein n=1 Tax=Nostoc sp. XA010 TaxID=2780407 RepID=UPI001E334FE6|nr:hypothetical protein [Nostoc sp. XA010]MCC5657293.1 hypothetical protein [Nostoc sp. XA010]